MCYQTNQHLQACRHYLFDVNETFTCQFDYVHPGIYFQLHPNPIARPFDSLNFVISLMVSELRRCLTSWRQLPTRHRPETAHGRRSAAICMQSGSHYTSADQSATGAVSRRPEAPEPAKSGEGKLIYASGILDNPEAGNWRAGERIEARKLL